MTDYQDKNPHWYRFVCSQAGTLGFVIEPQDDPQNRTEDYDWELFDITGKSPDVVYADSNTVVAGNWAGSFGSTGTTAFGQPGIKCASERDRFSAMPLLIEGHEYLLLVSSFYDGVGGYTLKFKDGTAVINDSTQAKLIDAKAGCDNSITVKLNKKLRCNTLSANGSEFAILPANATIVAATSATCSSGGTYMDEITLTFSNALSAGNYQLIINYGDDGNTLLDDCNNGLLPGDQVSFTYKTAQPVFADSIGSTGCSPGFVDVYFPKRIDCSSLAADGSDFEVTGPSFVTVTGASANCVNGLSDVVTVHFAAPIVVTGDYILTLKAGTDGSRLIDECDIEMPAQTMTFRAQEKVSAQFRYESKKGCTFNELVLSLITDQDANQWTWLLNDSVIGTTSTQVAMIPASGTNEVKLIVANGSCADTSSQAITTNNMVKADFEIPKELCPEDALQVTEKSNGSIDQWKWNFGNGVVTDVRNPPPQYFPQNNNESTYNVSLVVYNSIMNCSDSMSKPIKIFRYCYIVVPNAFTPNGDGLNDLLFPSNASKATNLEFTVFNRWGQRVFSTRSGNEKWDGKINGIMQPPGVYAWYLRYTDGTTRQQVFQKGTTTLIR